MAPQNIPSVLCRRVINLAPQNIPSEQLYTQVINFSPLNLRHNIIVFEHINNHLFFKFILDLIPRTCSQKNSIFLAIVFEELLHNLQLLF